MPQSCAHLASEFLLLFVRVANKRRWLIPAIRRETARADGVVLHVSILPAARTGHTFLEKFTTKQTQSHFY